MNPVYQIFNDIAQGMVSKEGDDEYISNTIKLLGASGEVHELSYNQAQLFLGVLDGSHSFLHEYNPLEFLIFSYQIQDKFKADYLATQYQIIYDHEDDSIFLSGITKHPMCVPGHPNYSQGAYIPPEQFQEHIPDVGLYGSLALVNCIASQAPEFNQIRGSFGGSFIFEFKDGQQSIKKYEPSALETLGIEQEELGSVIENAKAQLQRDLQGMGMDAMQNISAQSGVPVDFSASGTYDTYSSPASGV